MNSRLTLPLVVTASLLASTAVLANGAGATRRASPVIHLTMWQQWGGGHERAALDQIIREYEASHPNIRITEIPVTNNAKILSAITGGTPPDIIDLGTSLYLGEWASRGALMPLNGFIQRDHLNMGLFTANSWKPVTYQGKIYGLPFMDFDAGLLYNKKLFQAAGLNPNKPPTTLEQLQADAYRLTKVGPGGRIEQLGFYPSYPGQANGQVATLEDLGWLFGGNWYNPNTHKITANAPQNVRALAWEKSFFTKYGAKNMSAFIASAGTYLTPQDPFESGKLAMVYDGPWALAYVKANVPALFPYIGVAPFPAPAGESSRTGTTFLDTNPQVIPAGAKHAAAAFQFIAWEATNAKATATFAQLVANLPQLKNVPSFPWETDPRFRLFMQEAAGPNAHVWPQLTVSTQYGVDLGQAESAATIGGTSPRAALDQVQQNVSQALLGAP
jgi:multiple sugar transport system substrate-binding protein